VGNPVIVMAIMGYMGYRKRTGFLAGLTVAQISEFSLILAALGVSLGHLDQETMGLVTLVGLITISASTYMILYSHPLYERLAPWLTVFERRLPYREREDAAEERAPPDVVLIGLGRYGAALAAHLREQGCHLVAVDCDPAAVQRHREEGLDVRYGDAEDPELVGMLPLTETRWVVSAVRDRGINRLLLDALRQHGYKGRVAVATSRQQDASAFEREGVDLVLVPYSDAAREAASRILSSGECPVPRGSAGAA
jgi:hypothetical protein